MKQVTNANATRHKQRHRTRQGASLQRNPRDRRVGNELLQPRLHPLKVLVVPVAEEVEADPNRVAAKASALVLALAVVVDLVVLVAGDFQALESGVVHVGDVVGVGGEDIGWHAAEAVDVDGIDVQADLAEDEVPGLRDAEESGFLVGRDVDEDEVEELVGFESLGGC